jgi:membrane fusion protein, heavy metal efflux system
VKVELEKTNFDQQQALWDKRIASEQTSLQAKAAYTEASLRQDLARQKLSALGLNAAEVARLAKQDEGRPNGTEEGFEKREVETGKSDDEAVEITAGLKAGEEIAVANTFLLKAELGRNEAEHDH